MPQPEDIEIRSEEVQEILTKVPNWLIRYGITLIFVLIVGVLGISWSIKYPDTTVGKALISTESPPLYVSSRVSGRIMHVYAENGQLVEEGETLALIDNPIPSKSIDYLRELLDSVGTIIQLEKGYCDVGTLTEINLYEATNDYLNLKNTLRSLCESQKDTYTTQKLQSLKTKYQNYRKYKEVNSKEIELSRLDMVNAEERFQMKEAEFNLGVSSKLEYLNAQSAYNQMLKAQESLKKNEIQLTITLNDYQDQIHDFINSQYQKEKTDKLKLKELTELLKNHIVRWNNDFLIKSPVKGTVGFLDRITESQQVDAGSILMAVIPEESDFEVILDLPIQGFGKIKVGQEVKIKVDNFPANEFGTINGLIKTIPSLPKENVYRVKVKLPAGLITSYNRELVYQPEMTARAEVITEDLRLLERFFYQIRSVFN